MWYACGITSPTSGQSRGVPLPSVAAEPLHSPDPPPLELVVTLGRARAPESALPAPPRGRTRVPALPGFPRGWESLRSLAALYRCLPLYISYLWILVIIASSAGTWLTLAGIRSVRPLNSTVKRSIPGYRRQTVRTKVHSTGVRGAVSVPAERVDPPVVDRAGGLYTRDNPPKSDELGFSRKAIAPSTNRSVDPSLYIPAGTPRDAKASLSKSAESVGTRRSRRLHRLRKSSRSTNGRP